MARVRTHSKPGDAARSVGRAVSDIRSSGPRAWPALAQPNLVLAGNRALRGMLGSTGCVQRQPMPPLVPAERPELFVTHRWMQQANPRPTSESLLDSKRLAKAVAMLARLTDAQRDLIHHTIGNLTNQTSGEGLANALAHWQVRRRLTPTGWLDLPTMYQITADMVAEGRRYEVVELIINQHRMPFDPTRDVLEISGEDENGKPVDDGITSVWAIAQGDRMVLQIPTVMVTDRTSEGFQSLVNSLWQETNRYQLRPALGLRFGFGDPVAAFQRLFAMLFPADLPREPLVELATGWSPLFCRLLVSYDQIPVGSRTPLLQRAYQGTIRVALVDLEVYLRRICPRGGLLERWLLERPESLTSNEVDLALDLFQRLSPEHRTPETDALRNWLIKISDSGRCN